MPLIVCCFLITPTPILLYFLQENIKSWKTYLSNNRLNLNNKKTKFITFSREKDNKLNDLETVVAKTKSQKSDQYKQSQISV